MNLPSTIREKLAQLIFVRIGSNTSPIRDVEQDASRIKALLERCPIGGLILFNGTRDHTPSALEELQSNTNTPLLVAADIERGVGQQLRGFPQFPHARAFTALGPDAEQYVQEFAYLTSIASRAAGIQIALAPVADMNLHPKNPIVSTRSYGTNVEQVSTLVTAYIEGCLEGGLLTTAKHFPGHGNTCEDSHHVLPTVECSLEEMLQQELTVSGQRLILASL